VANYYGTVAAADTYFGERLNSEAWERAIAGDRLKALIMAARAIDRLNFIGEKTDDDQDLQFPRGEDTDVPTDILYAAYECAHDFLDGVDMDFEREQLGVVADAYSGVRATYDSHYTAVHIVAGIPSSQAWSYLQPYIVDPREVTLSRVS
jgi:hypothetical protein